MREAWAQPYLTQKSVYPPGTSFTIEEYFGRLVLHKVDKPDHYPYVKPFVAAPVESDTWPFVKQPWGSTRV